MKKGVITTGIIVVLIMLLATSTTYATNQTIDNNFKDTITQYIEEITNIRKQFMAISESGYVNHIQGKPNKENVANVKLYMGKIKDISKKITAYQTEYESSVLEKRIISTLIATTLYLETMGENLIEYLEAQVLPEQYDFYNYHIQINQFIINILASVGSEI